ncbi:LLM class flavin-dependent oxidoreductase [Rhodococcus sp. AD45-ID]|uniref:LLM class flavin-dependent oxidoreductase n=1 Tax=unclassified Rhodococcus (in: high G+C Gram-positive bacteria) TaxID=192944 RepID=UPI0005D45074|nr:MULTISPECIES: LLM class flavin-dependent oxidoreductase [unclassified Rhodococcus (in: high G+C Gram-positive bacteria)]KJF22887.1 putative monooxygenase moxC [Rhodococcus sp. AD45]PSR40763.1 LLM class flavin-dependent oxidoreductase [Rhodococcus sp. AD45-ID]
MSKRIRLNAVTVNGPTVSPGLWAHPDDHAHEFTSLDYWVRLARTLERGRFDAVFFADMLGLYDVYHGNPAPALTGAIQVPIHDPTYLVPAMAEVTEHLGFAVTVSTTYENPYTVARTLSTLDLLTEGRVGWNIVTSNLDSAARLHGHSTQVDVEDRYARGEEFLDVAYELWERSWEDHAVVIDKAAGVYTDPALVQGIEHRGTWFSVPGVHTIDPTPQRTPLLFQAGSSERGRQFAAAHAEAVFLNTPTMQATKFIVDDVRQRAEKLGRDPDSVLFFPKITPIVGADTADAHRRFRDFLRFSSTDGIFTLLGAWTGIDFAEAGEDKLLGIASKSDTRGLVESLRRQKPGGDWSSDELAQVFAFGTSALTIGGPEEVADELEEFIDFTGADGFNVASVVQPGTIDDFVDHVVPELQKRGRVQTEYAAGTLREKLTGRGPGLPDNHPGRRASSAVRTP